MPLEGFMLWPGQAPHLPASHPYTKALVAEGHLIGTDSLPMELPTAGAQPFQAYNGTMLGVGPTAVIIAVPYTNPALVNVADWAYGQDLEVCSLPFGNTAGPWTGLMTLSELLASFPDLAGFNQGGYYQMLVDAEGGIWLAVNLWNPNLSVNGSVAVLLYLPNGGAWTRVWTEPSGMQTIQFGGPMKSLLYFLSPSTNAFQVWNGTGFSAINATPFLAYPNQTDVVAPLIVLSPTEVWGYTNSYGQEGQGSSNFLHFVNGAWSAIVNLDGSVGLNGDMSFYSTSQGGLIFCTGSRANPASGGALAGLFDPVAVTFTPVIFSQDGAPIFEGVPVTFLTGESNLNGNSMVQNVVETQDGALLVFALNGGYD